MKERNLDYLTDAALDTLLAVCKEGLGSSETKVQAATMILQYCYRVESMAQVEQQIEAFDKTIGGDLEFHDEGIRIREESTT